MRRAFDISAYLVVGPENTLGRPVRDIVAAAVSNGFSCVQLRSKTSSAIELVELTREAANAISALGRTGRTALLVNDRLDVVLAARDMGIHVDGIHVGQSDIPVSVCRKYLGEGAVIGLSARKEKLLDYVRKLDVSDVDYFGVGPFHESATKPESGKDSKGNVTTRSLEELRELASFRPRPVVVGGGVTAADLPSLASVGVDGFFVVSAVAGAVDPGHASKELVEIWRKETWKNFNGNGKILI